MEKEKLTEEIDYTLMRITEWKQNDIPINKQNKKKRKKEFTDWFRFETIEMAHLMSHYCFNVFRMNSYFKKRFFFANILGLELFMYF